MDGAGRGSGDPGMKWDEQDRIGRVQNITCKERLGLGLGSLTQGTDAGEGG